MIESRSPMTKEPSPTASEPSAIAPAAVAEPEKPHAMLPSWLRESRDRIDGLILTASQLRWRLGQPFPSSRRPLGVDGENHVALATHHDAGSQGPVSW